MKHTNKLTSILLTLALLLGMLPWTALPARADAPAGTFAQLQALLDRGGTVTLDRDYATGDEAFCVGGDVTVTLDLAGHAISRSGGSGCIFSVASGGSLTLTDSAGGGTVSGGTGTYGGGVYVYSNGTFTMNGGTISGNRTTGYGGGGGVYVYSNGTFTMNGGTIAGNSAADRGGGVYLNDGTFTMNGGTITGNETTGGGSLDPDGGGVYINGGAFTMNGGTLTGNSATGKGGGVYVSYGTTFTMTGGAITGNSADGEGGGVYVNEHGEQTFRVSGEPVVIGNTAGNVFLPADTTVIVTGALASIASIGVTTATAPAAESPVTFAQGGGEPAHTLNANDVSCFFSDNAAYGVVYKDGAAKLSCDWTVVKMGSSPTLSAALQAGGLVRLGGDVTIYTSVCTFPAPVTLDLSGFVINCSTAYESACNVQVNGPLTLIDSQPAATHTDTTLPAGGVIANGRSTTGGVDFNSAGTFTMLGGTICGNSASSYGGGVYVPSRATFLMLGGTICGNSASSCGGGVSVDNGGTFVMLGGTISGNSAQEGGGVYLYSGSTFRVSGSPVVSGNVAGGAANNVHFATGVTCAVTGALGSGASIGVTMQTLGVFAQAAEDYNGGKLTESDLAHFTSDNDAYLVALTAGGKAELTTETKVDTWSALYDALQKNGRVLLTGDVKYGTGGDHANSALEVPDGKTVTLDLAGHVVDRALTSIAMSDYGNVIMVSGTLTLVDGAPAEKHTGGYASLPDGGVITGAYGDYGGVYVGSGGTLTMNGGTITGNTANYYGGGVYVRDGGTFTMNGGTITGNDANEEGDGVYVDGAFNVSGSARVSGNGKNVYLQAGKTITVTGALTGEIGVTMVAYKNYVPVPAVGVFAQAAEGYTLKDTDVSHFTSDNDDYLVALTAGGKAELYKPAAGVTLNTDMLSLTVGGSETLTATVSPDDATHSVTWSSSDEDVAAVDESGKVTAVSAGTATITAAVDGKSAICDVIVIGVSGKWVDGRLTAAVCVSNPANTLLIAAEYDALGRLAGVKTVTLEAGRTGYDTGLTYAAGHTYRLMLVDRADFAPLYAAWSSSAAA